MEGLFSGEKCYNITTAAQLSAAVAQGLLPACLRHPHYTPRSPTTMFVWEPPRPLPSSGSVLLVVALLEGLVPKPLRHANGIQLIYCSRILGQNSADGKSIHHDHRGAATCGGAGMPRMLATFS
jgi:hypothetical protein